MRIKAKILQEKKAERENSKRENIKMHCRLQLRLPKFVYTYSEYVFACAGVPGGDGKRQNVIFTLSHGQKV